MIASSNIKFLLNDQRSLLDYRNNKAVGFEKIKQRLYLRERVMNITIPDHYYKLNQEFSFKNLKELSDIMTKGICHLSDEYLELRERKVYVKQDKQNEWQELITFIPPLLLVSYFLTSKRAVNLNSMRDILEFYNDWIVPNTRYTALPSPYLPQLEMYVKENNGFHDLHMHLNGATETDVTWQDFLYHHEDVYRDMQKGYEIELVQEQYEQESYDITPVEYHELLISALRLRQYFYRYLFGELKTGDEDTGIAKILSEINSVDSKVFTESIFHPFYDLINPGYNTDEYDKDRHTLLSVESLMYVLLFNRLIEYPHDELAQLFHYYLLILGFTNRMLVQQTHQFGFTQFQKVTLNELREQSEAHYLNRFFQLQGNDVRNIHVLEGRFAPKDRQDKLIELLKKIENGWDGLLKHIPSDVTQPELNLVAHFIKRKDKREDEDLRHKELRYRVWNQALILGYLKKNQPDVVSKVVAIDAASSEFDTPPEVFAPAFRMLRRKGYKHFTYHAGEDFYHIITGLRAIYEAVIFNELGAGDRIGHATATGISPIVWECNVGNTILMRRGEYLDDLVFIYHLLIQRVKKNPRLEVFKMKIPFMINHIQELGCNIYKSYYPIKVYEDAWLLRKYCPIILNTLTFDKMEAYSYFNDQNPFKCAEELSVFDFEEWSSVWEEVKNSFGKAENIELLKKYHNKFYDEAYNEIIEVKINDCFTLEEIEMLQLAVLDFLHEREIIIETLPTSNIRIGHHVSFNTYHLWNWLEWEKKGHSIPPIVVGTDDTGIFATNIFNEFANIYCFLTHTKKMSHSNALEIIQRLERNARIYRFV